MTASRLLTVISMAVCVTFSCISGNAAAGPPFLTDDPEPTETGHWEIYAPVVEAAGQGVDIEGAVSVELNYGAAPNLQITLGLPIDYAQNGSGRRWGTGDIELSAKYRIIHDESAGLQVALFPGVTLPTGSKGLGIDKVTALLPIWIQKDAGPWSIFGGGGYAINPGVDNRDYWTGGLALTRRFSDSLLFGLEANRQSADTVGGHASTSLGLGAIYQLKAPFRLLASGGPTFEDHDGTAHFHAFLALGLDF
jgi:Putative MetA-pathway of phenol degradation